MTPRLHRDTLERLPAGVQRPARSWGITPPGVLHLGVGNFHRAHQAIAFEDLALAGDARWGVCGVSLRRPVMRDALVAQDGLYTVLERDGRGAQARVVGSLRELLVAPESPATVRDRLASPNTRLVTLTITEKGYDQTDAGSALALLVEGLAARHAAGVGGLTLLSCDNLSRNGGLLHERLIRAASPVVRDGSLAGAPLARWIEHEVVCPDTMVDRIVPATTDADRAQAEQVLGLHDAWPVATEPFSQWVIEARFAGEAPPLDRVGAQWVDDVAAWEAMKLRLLNAAHSSLAYLGVPLGLATVDEAAADPSLRIFLARLWRQVEPTLPASVRGEVGPYTGRLLERFANPALRHALRQISADGSRKLPQRLLVSLREARRQGLPHDALLLGVAAWLHFLIGEPDPHARSATRWSVDDPLAGQLLPVARKEVCTRDRVGALLGVQAVFADDLHQDSSLLDALTRALERLRTQGARAAISSID